MWTEWVDVDRALGDYCARVTADSPGLERNLPRHRAPEPWAGHLIRPESPVLWRNWCLDWYRLPCKFSRTTAHDDAG